MTIKWQDDAVLLIIGAFLLGFLLAHGGQTTSNDTIHEKQIIRARPDTAHSVIDIPLRPLNIRAQSNRIKTIVLHDTIYREACLDTLLRSDTSAAAPDTLSVCYARNIFSVSLGFSPRRKSVAVPYIARDTFYWREDSIRVASASSRAWYDDALVVILSLAAGIVVGKL
jgi:hypothetical protein